MKEYFIRFTDSIQEDLQKASSVHLTPFETEKEAEEFINNNSTNNPIDWDEPVVVVDGNVCFKLSGLCCYSVDWEGDLEELKDYILERYLQNSYSETVHLCEGEYEGDCEDGDVAKLHKVVKSFVVKNDIVEEL